MGKHIVLTSKQLQQIPGYSTSLSVANLKGKVAASLTEAGLDYALVTRNGSELIMIEMVLPTEELDVKRVVHFKLEVPQIYQKLKKGSPKPLPAVGWRFFYDYLERRLASVKLGVTDLIEEFSANLVMLLSDGREIVLADLIKEQAANPQAPLLPFVLEAV